MAKNCPEEGINPWPPYVDIFSSTILVLLLFMLVLYSIIAYNAQFISKVKYQESVKNEKEVSSVMDAQQILNVLAQHIEKREQTPVPIASITVTDKNTSKLFEGGLEQGGMVSADNLKKEPLSEFKKEEMMIVFKNKDIFVSPQLLDEVKRSITQLLNKNPNSKIEIKVGDPKLVISSTMAKQISLGRILNIKNKLNAVPKFKDKVEISFDQEDKASQDYGFIKINIK